MNKISIVDKIRSKNDIKYSKYQFDKENSLNLEEIANVIDTFIVVNEYTTGIYLCDYCSDDGYTKQINVFQYENSLVCLSCNKIHPINQVFLCDKCGFFGYKCPESTIIRQITKDILKLVTGLDYEKIQS